MDENHQCSSARERKKREGELREKYDGCKRFRFEKFVFKKCFSLRK